ncbi:unnamed protein product [Discosporangium mesarthrocarpum]
MIETYADEIQDIVGKGKEGLKVPPRPGQTSCHTGKRLVTGVGPSAEVAESTGNEGIAAAEELGGQAVVGMLGGINPLMVTAVTADKSKAWGDSGKELSALLLSCGGIGGDVHIDGGIASPLDLNTQHRVVFEAVRRSLTIFHSRQNSIMILSYKGRQVADTP